VIESREIPPQILRLEGEFWTIVFGGHTCCLRDTVGVRYLAHLLGRPHDDVSALEIVAAAKHADTSCQQTFDPKALERARVNVTRAVKAVLARLEAHHPYLHQHLRATVRTGAACSYKPDPRLPAVWEGDIGGTIVPPFVTPLEHEEV